MTKTVETSEVTHTNNFTFSNILRGKRKKKKIL